MQKTSGSNRNVYISDDVVYKVPKICYFSLGNTIKGIILKGRITKEREYLFNVGVKKGFIANENERNIFNKLKSLNLEDIISKVKFSIPYILNIQENCQVIKNIQGNFLSEDIKLCIPDKELYPKECHTFANRVNYGIINGKIVILDYGGEFMGEIFEKYGENIKSWFDKSSFYYVKIEKHLNLLHKEQQEEITGILNKKHNSLDEKLEDLIYIYNTYFKKYE